MLKKTLAALICAAAFVAPSFAETSLKFSMVQGPQSNEFKAVTAMADLIKEKTGGEVTVKIYTDAQLGDDVETMEQMTAGTIDMGLAAIGRYGVWMPEMILVQYPYTFKNFDHIKSFTQSDYFKGRAEEMRKQYNWRILSLAYGGSRHTTTTSKPIESVADMKGLKLRVPKAKGNMTYASGAGASPTPMSFSEVYLALKTNAVDGQENPLSIINAAKFYEVQKYLTLTGHIIAGVNVLISDLTWERVPSKYHAAIQEGADVAAEQFTSMYMADEKNLLGKFEEAGVTVINPNIDEFMAKFEPVQQEYLKEYGDKGAAVLAAVNASK